jgi:hypothetical protein
MLRSGDESDEVTDDEGKFSDMGLRQKEHQFLLAGPD